MKTSKFTIFLLPVIFVLALTTCTVQKIQEVEESPTNIILFIGDGMGIAQFTSAVSTSGAPLHIAEMPVIGLVKTSSSDNYVTDSAAGGTAISSGVKTRNGMIGMDPDSTSVETIVEIANRNGLATGVLSTSAVTHATPASFVAHNISRNNYEAIAADFANGKIDLFMGGGLNNFTKRKDGIDLTTILREKGYAIVTTADELSKVTSGKVAGLFSESHMPYASEGRPISLAVMTRKSIEILSKNEKGFFLMVEGSMIDWAAHDGLTEGIISETLDMDEAVGEALAFAKTHDNTLVIVTSDHETGGMALAGGSLKDRTVEARYPTGEHTAVMVPVFSSGAGADKFGGVMENTELFERIIRALGIK